MTESTSEQSLSPVLSQYSNMKIQKNSTEINKSKIRQMLYYRYSLRVMINNNYSVILLKNLCIIFKVSLSLLGITDNSHIVFIRKTLLVPG